MRSQLNILIVDKHRRTASLTAILSLFKSLVAERLNDGEQRLEAGEYTTRE